MDKKTKVWLVIGLLVIAGIIGFAIYRGIGSSTDTTTVTSGGSMTRTTNGLGDLLKGLFGLGA